MWRRRQQVDSGLARKRAFQEKLRAHFRVRLETLEIVDREFRPTSWVDLQPAIEKLMASLNSVEVFGIHSGRFSMDRGPGLAGLFKEPDYSSPEVGATEFVNLPDIGERRLKNGLWLGVGDVPMAFLANGPTLQVAAPPSNGAYIDRCIHEVEKIVEQAGTMRGRVISLCASRSYGDLDRIDVHKLRKVSRDEVILPARTLEILDSNVQAFIRARERMKVWGFSGKKGLLFYGPPGTGKTHTIHYLASQLPGHTTLLISADDLGRISTYFEIARFLQPAMVVIEDVDLIATARV